MCGIYAHYLEEIPFVLEGKQYGLGAWWLIDNFYQRPLGHST